MPSPAVDPVHAGIDSILYKQGDNLEHHRGLALKKNQFFGCHSPQDELIHGLAVPIRGDRRTPDANLHPGELLGAEVTDNRTDTVMSAGAPAAHHLDPAGIEVDIVVQDKEVFAGYFEIIHITAHTFTGAVHVSFWFQAEKLATKSPSLAIQPLHFQDVHPPTLRFDQMIEKEKTDIVPGQMILAPRITKPYQQISRIRHGRTEEQNKRRAETCFRLAWDQLN